MATLTIPQMIESGAPRVIRNDDELEAYTDQLFALTELDNPLPAEVESIKLLSLLVQTYEAKAYPVPEASPLEVLRYLMERHQVTQAGLQEEIGSQAFTSRILRGERQLTTKHIKALAKRFSVPVSVFI